MAIGPIITTAGSSLASIETVDGSGSGLDADLFDGHDSSYFEPMAVRTLNTQTADYTLVIGDAAKEIVMNKTSAAATLTLPLNASVPFPVGTRIPVRNINNAGYLLTIACPGGTITGAIYVYGISTSTSVGRVVCEKTATDTWLVYDESLGPAAYVDSSSRLRTDLAMVIGGTLIPIGGVLNALLLASADGSGVFKLTDQTTKPSAPAAGIGQIFTQKICGRDLPFIQGANGLAHPIQLAGWAVNRVESRSTTTTGASNWGSVTYNGTVSTPTMSEALGPNTQLAGAASTSALAGMQSTNLEFLIGSAQARQLIPSASNGDPQLFNGLWLVARVYLTDANYNNTGASTGTRLNVGFSDQSAATAGGSDNPAGSRAMFSRCHVNGGLLETNWWFSTKDGTTEQRTDTTMAATAQHQYEFFIYCPGGGSTITWRIDDITAGTSATGTVATHNPAGATLMRVMAMCETVDATVRNLQVSRFYAEACL